MKRSSNYLFKILSKSGKNLLCSWIMDKCISKGKQDKMHADRSVLIRFNTGKLDCPLDV